MSIHDYIYLKYTISLNDSIIFVNDTSHDIAIKTMRSVGQENMVALIPKETTYKYTPDVSGVFFFQSTSAFHMYGEIEVV